MFPAHFRYHRVSTFDEAVQALGALGPDARPMAGGQTLIPMMKLRLLRPSHLVDLRRISDGAEVVVGPETIGIGALASHRHVGRSDAARRFPIIGDCALGIADPQVRSLGTIGGSLAEADPSSCWPTMLTALDAQVRCLGPAGARIQSVRALLRDAYSPALEPGELITGVQIDSTRLLGHGAFVAFKRAAPAYPTASVALQLRLEDGQVAAISLALGCVGLTPLAVDTAAPMLLGRPPTAAAIDSVAQHAAEVSEPLADNKGSEAYKRSLVRGLVRRAFAVALARHEGRAVPPTHTYYG